MTTYTDAARIAAALGRPLTDDQTERADEVAAAVTAWIDHRTGRSWQQNGAITAEFQQIAGDRVFLRRAPVAAITSVAVHPGQAVASWTTLDTADYTLFDPLNGLLLLPIGYSGWYVQADYTSETVPPDDIMAAADALAADLLSVTLTPESAGVESLALGQNDINIKYSGSSGEHNASVKTALAMVDAHRLPVTA